MLSFFRGIENKQMKPDFPQTARSLPIALLRARERLMGPIRSRLAESGVTEQQWRVLRVIQEHDLIDPTQISAQACLLLPSLTRILQKLEENGMILRQRDTQDRRRQLISITPAGEALINRHLEDALTCAEDLRNRLGPEKHDALLDLLNDLVALDV